MTTSKDPSYPWYPRDAMVDFERLSSDAELITRRLLDFQWLDLRLDADPKVLATLNRKVPPARWRKAWAEIAHLFPLMDGDQKYRQNRRLERVRAERDAFHERQSQRGKKGAERRWLNHQNDGASMPTPLPEHSPSNAKAIADGMLGDSSASASASATKRTTSRRTAATPQSWVAEAVELWAEAIGVVSHGRMGKALKPVVDRWPWDTGDPKGQHVKRWLRVYLDARPYTRRDGSVWGDLPTDTDANAPPRDTRFCTPDDFAQNIQQWRNRCLPLKDRGAA